MEGILIRAAARVSGQVEICRSFAYKLNVGNYESRDFFASMKGFCDATDAEVISQQLYEFCEAQVLGEVRDYRRKMENQRERKTA